MPPNKRMQSDAAEPRRWCEALERNMMRSYFVIGGVVAALISGNVQAAPDSEYLQFIENHGGAILDTYRIPEGDDLSYWGTDSDTYFYKTLDSDLDEKAPFWTKGFFNSDAHPDYLFIMFNRANNKAFLMGFISSENGYESIVIEPSNKYMAVATKKNTVGHFHLEGHGHGLSWNENEAKFNVIQ